MLTIPTKPLSMNSAYPTNKQGRRFLTSEGAAYKTLIGIKARAVFPDLIGCQDTVRATVVVYGPILTKNGTVSKTAMDLDNCLKLMLDAVTSALGFDDSLIVSIQAEKQLADEWGFTLDLARMPWSFHEPTSCH